MGASNSTEHEEEEEVHWDEFDLVPGPINSGDFYGNYHGHLPDHLARLHKSLKDNGRPRFVYLVGDSSLDNKHWFFRPFSAKSVQLEDPEFTAPALNGYEMILSSPRMVMDIAYHLNAAAISRADDFGGQPPVTINAAVEESTIASRDKALQIQDIFVRDHVTNDDFVIISLGGNDVALRPTTSTILNMLALTRSPEFLISTGLAPGFQYFFGLFHDRIELFVRRLLAKCKPRKVPPYFSYCDHVIDADMKTTFNVR